MSSIIDFLRDLFRPPSGEQHPLDTSPAPMPSSSPQQGKPAPVHPRVLAIVHNPVMRTHSGRKIQEVYRWNDPDALAQEYIEDIRKISYGYANYQIVERLEVDSFPLKKDGYRYTDESFSKAWQARQFHQPDAVDYLELVREFNMIEKINADAIDEVWLLGFPYCGYYESIMAGPNALWCNAPALQGTEHASRRFVIMGFNYERGVGEMLENLGHRAESMMSKIYSVASKEANLWERFTRYDLKNPGLAECGNVHFAPNSVKDYDWGNPRQVPSRCDTWLNFPNLNGTPRSVNCRDWGNGDIRAHHQWWFQHFPHVSGSINGVSMNWWEYVIDPNKVIEVQC